MEIIKIGQVWSDGNIKVIITDIDKVNLTCSAQNIDKSHTFSMFGYLNKDFSPSNWGRDWICIEDDSKLIQPIISDYCINTATIKAINDYTCPTCKNDRCSKSEVTCWLCGNKL